MYASSSDDEITNDRLEELIDRAKFATYGSWVIDSRSMGGEIYACGQEGGRRYVIIRDGDGRDSRPVAGLVKFFHNDCGNDSCPDKPDQHECDQWFDDVSFIMEANPKVVTEICKELLALRKQVQEVK
jgi:hypothetical protein